MKTIYYNGDVYDGGGAAREAFIVENGRFGFVGASAQALALTQGGDQAVDLGGRFVCAGLNDSHMHLLGYGQALRTARLSEHTGSLAGMLSYFRAFAAEHPPRAGAWLMGRGWNQDYFSDEKRMPNRYDLDQVSGVYPVAAVRCCGHCLAVNSAALKLLHLTDGAPEIAGGRVGMQNGVPDGLFYDNAMALVYDALPSPGKDEIKEMLRAACRALNARGITSCQTDDYGVFSGVPWQTVNAAYNELKQDGGLTVRVYEQANFGNVNALRAYLDAGNQTGAGDDWFRAGPLKLLGDGALGARTAYLSRPYADAPGTRGLSVFSREELRELIGYAHARSMQIAVHAIGDGCLDDVLAAYEAALSAFPRADHRHGIVHCQITRPEQLQKIAALKLHVYAQSIFLDYDTHIVHARVGDTLAASSYHWKTLMKLGATVSNGTDCPVEAPDPLRCMQCAVTRAPLSGGAPYLPDERFTAREALDSYTKQSAFASFDEGRKGIIAPGYLADFTVLSQNPFSAPPETIKDIRVCACAAGGRMVFSADERRAP